eukprot:COSAG03_NODE_7979_length_849_cov_1.204000_1_plen_147_part_00
MTSRVCESVLSSGLGWRRNPSAAADVVGVWVAAEMLSPDLRESYAEAHRKPGSALVGACRWVMVAAAYALVLVGIHQAMFQLYFDDVHLRRCDGLTALDTTRHWIETFIGAALAQARTALLTAVSITLCRKVTQDRSQVIAWPRRC